MLEAVIVFGQTLLEIYIEDRLDDVVEASHAHELAVSALDKVWDFLSAFLLPLIETLSEDESPSIAADAFPESTSRNHRIIPIHLDQRCA